MVVPVLNYFIRTLAFVYDPTLALIYKSHDFSGLEWGLNPQPHVWYDALSIELSSSLGARWRGERYASASLGSHYIRHASLLE